MGLVSTFMVLPVEDEARLATHGIALGVRRKKSIRDRFLDLFSSQLHPADVALSEVQNRIASASGKGQPMEGWYCEVDKAWDAIGKALAELVSNGRATPAAARMMVDEDAQQSPGGCIVDMRGEDEVRQIAEAVEPIGVRDFMSVRDAALADAYVADGIGRTQFVPYIFRYFQAARRTYQTAAREARPILIVVQ